MQELTFCGPADLRWAEAEAPDLRGDGEALVRPVAVASCDLDALIVAGASPFPPAFPIGHEGVAEVVALGDGVRRFAIGDRVVVPFQISCGTCPPCQQGRTAACAAVPPASTYGFGFPGARWGGFLSDLVRVPYADHMLVPLPAGVAPEAAAGVSDNVVDAYRTVAALADRWPGAPVLVVGGAAAGSIGLLAAGLARALGAERVLYVDPDERRRDVAARLGAAVLGDVPERLDEAFPITVDASADPRGLELALRSTAPDGTCTSTGIYFDPAAAPRFPLLEMYVKGVTFRTGRPHVRACADEVVGLLAAGTFDPSAVTTRTVAWADAAPALAERDWAKLVIRR